MSAPVVAAIVAFLTGGTLPIALGVGSIPSGIFSTAKDVDSIATTIAAHSEAICRATDPLLDKIADAEDAKLGAKTSLLRRLEDNVARMADAACAHAGQANTLANRLAAARDALNAITGPSADATQSGPIFTYRGRGR